MRNLIEEGNRQVSMKSNGEASGKLQIENRWGRFSFCWSADLGSVPRF